MESGNGLPVLAKPPLHAFRMAKVLHGRVASHGDGQFPEHPATAFCLLFNA